VLAHDDGLHLVSIHVGDAPDDAAQTHGVESGARTEDVASRQVEVAIEVLGDHVGGVGHADEEAIEPRVADGPHDAVEDGEGALEHLQARLAGLAAPACRHDDEVCIRAVIVGAHAETHVTAECREHVSQVGHLGVCGLLVDVEKHDLVGVLLVHEVHRDVRAHVACADDDDLA